MWHRRESNRRQPAWRPDATEERVRRLDDTGEVNDESTKQNSTTPTGTRTRERRLAKSELGKARAMERWIRRAGGLEQGAVQWRPCRASARLLLAAGENGAHRKAPRRATMVSWSWAHGAGGWSRDAELGRRRRKAEQRRARLRAWSSAMKLGERDAGRGTASPVVTMALCREAEWRTALQPWG